MKVALGCLLATPVLAVLSTPAQAGDVFSDGKAIFDARYRFENVDQGNTLRDADANTLRTRLGFQTGQWNGVSGLVEFDNVTHLGSEHYNSTRNGNTAYPVVADPDGSEVNQASLRYDGSLGGITLGRQRINLDNQRFVGGVAWRQNEQTFDGALVEFKPIDRFVARYAWLDNINTVFGPDDDGVANVTNAADIHGTSHLFNVQYEFLPELTATAYQYRLDLDNVAVTSKAPLGTLSSITTGARFNGTFGGLSYAFEYARQKELDGNPWQLDSDYSLIEAGYKFKQVQLKAGYESLGSGRGGSGNRAFQTPLATKHLFEGWADVFLTTPADGLEDTYVGLTAALAGGSLQAWYHDFSSDRGGSRYGNEVDVSYGRNLGLKGLAGLLKYARYESADPARTVDTDKLWAQLQYSY